MMCLLLFTFVTSFKAVDRRYKIDIIGDYGDIFGFLSIIMLIIILLHATVIKNREPIGVS